MISGGRLSICSGCRHGRRQLIERERSASCKPRWQPPSEDLSSFGPRRIGGDQRQKAFEHVGQGRFTRKRNRHDSELRGRALRFDFSRFGFGLAVCQTGQLHHVGRFNSIAAQYVCNCPREIERKSRLLVPLFVLKIGISGIADIEFLGHFPN